MIWTRLLSLWRYGVRMMDRMHRIHLGLISAGVAFYGMFAVFPGLAAVVSLWGMFGDPSVIFTYLNVADNFLPNEAEALIDTQVSGFVLQGRTSLGWASALSILIATLAARAGVDALVRGINAIHLTRPPSGFRRYLLGYLLTLALVGVVLLGLLTVVVVPLALHMLDLGPLGGWLITGLPWGAVFLIVLITIGILYRYSPTTEGPRPPLFSWGALIAALLWAAASVAFSAYLGRFDSYNRIYGSIGAVVALQMWFFLASYSVLLGALFNVELRRYRRNRRAGVDHAKAARAAMGRAVSTVEPPESRP